MASYLRPKRGKRTTAIEQNIVLMKGEVFFEAPENGIGTGIGKIKIGDGFTNYANLPYFMEATNVELSTIAFTDSSVATDPSNNSTYLNNIKPANDLKTIFTNLKQLLFNYNKEIKDNKDNISILNNDVPFKFGIDDQGNYGYYKAGADTVTPFKTTTVVKLGTGTSFNVSQYPGYQTFTAANFYVVATELHCRYAGGYAQSPASSDTGRMNGLYTQGGADSTQADYAISKSYNQSTGVFTVGNTSIASAQQRIWCHSKNMYQETIVSGQNSGGDRRVYANIAYNVLLIF